MEVLVVAEKPRAARRIAQHMGSGPPNRRVVRGVTTYELDRDGDTWTVMGLHGHIFEVDYPPDLNDWGTVSPMELVEANPEHRVVEDRDRHVAALRDLSRDADRVVIATDHDREGELIGKEAMDVISEAATDISVDRVRFSSLTEEDVRQAFRRPDDLDENLAASAQARRIVDLVWGACLTRFMTETARAGGADDLYSVGRVQSPTLALLVDRERKREGFDPTPYWEVYADIEASGNPLKAQHVGGDEEGRFWDETEARNHARRATAADEAQVTSVTERTTRDPPPHPFDTTSFLEEAANLDLSAKQALDTAEDLYVKGLVSYPRTDNTVYPESLDLTRSLDSLEETPLGHEAQRLDEGTLDPVSGGTRTTDHPPIHPTAPASPDDLSPEEWDVYELVSRRFLATLSEPAEIETKEVKLDLEDEPFQAHARRVANPGYRQVYPYGETEEAPLPEIGKGDEPDVRGIDIHQTETTPPPRHGEGELIRTMEEHGVGTKSTRPDVVERLYERGYVTGDPPRPTEKGRDLIAALEPHAERITDPAMTAELEAEMEAIAEGGADLEAVVRRSREGLTEVLRTLASVRSEIRNELAGGSGPKALGPCDVCGAPLEVRWSPGSGRWAGCSSYPGCENTYSLPLEGDIDPRGWTCDNCDTPVVAIDYGGGGSSVICLSRNCDGPS